MAGSVVLRDIILEVPEGNQIHDAVIKPSGKVLTIVQKKFDVRGKPYIPYSTYVLDYDNSKIKVYYLTEDIAINYRRDEYADGDLQIALHFSNPADFVREFGTYESFISEIQAINKARGEAIGSVYESTTGQTAHSQPANLIRSFIGVGRRKQHTRKRRNKR